MTTFEADEITATTTNSLVGPHTDRNVEYPLAYAHALALKLAEILAHKDVHAHTDTLRIADLTGQALDEAGVEINIRVVASRSAATVALACSRLGNGWPEASALAEILPDTLALAAARLIGVEPQRWKGLSEAFPTRGLDDFTSADLTGADLAGSELNGIYWSEWGTAWPAGFDVNQLRRASRDMGGGIYHVEHRVRFNARASATI